MTAAREREREERFFAQLGRLRDDAARRRVL